LQGGAQGGTDSLNDRRDTMINDESDEEQQQYTSRTPGEVIEREVDFVAGEGTMCGYIFERTEDHRAKIERAYPQGELEKCPHIVGCVHKILCGENLTRPPEGTTSTIQSATTLKKAGIQIKAIKGVLDEL